MSSKKMITSKSKLVLVLLILIATIITAYTISAHYVASRALEFGGALWWRTTAGGSFYPWPHIPSGLAGEMTTQFDQEDYTYYNYVIRSGVLIVLTIVLWIIVLWKVWRMRAFRENIS